MFVVDVCHYHGDPLPVHVREEKREKRSHSYECCPFRMNGSYLVVALIRGLYPTLGAFQKIHHFVSTAADSRSVLHQKMVFPFLAKLADKKKKTIIPAVCD